MAVRRTYGSYNDGCASTHALDLIGERWALVVVRELLLGPKRFVDIQRDIPGIGPSVLSKRLAGLEATGIVVRRNLSGATPVMMYDLTDWGRELEEVNAALSRWAVRSSQLPLEADMSPDTLVLAMRAHVRPLAPGAQSWKVALRLTDSRVADREPVEYLATFASEGSCISKASNIEDRDALVSSTTSAWKRLIINGGSFSDCGDTAIEGDEQAAIDLLHATQLHEAV